MALEPREGLGGPGVVKAFAVTSAKDALFLPFFLPVVPTALGGTSQRQLADAPCSATLVMAGETSLIGVGEGAGSEEWVRGTGIKSPETSESSQAYILPFSKGQGVRVRI